MEQSIGSSIYSKMRLLFDKNIKSAQNDQKLFMTPIIVFKIIAQAILSNFVENKEGQWEENSLYLPQVSKSNEDFMDEDDENEDQSLNQLVDQQQKFVGVSNWKKSI